MINQTIVLTHNTPFASLEEAIADYSMIRNAELDNFFANVAGSTVHRFWNSDDNQTFNIATMWINNEEYTQYMSYETQRNDIITRLSANGWTFVSVDAAEA